MNENEKFKDLIKMRDMVLNVADGKALPQEKLDVYRIFGDLNEQKIEGVLYGLNKAIIIMI